MMSSSMISFRCLSGPLLRGMSGKREVRVDPVLESGWELKGFSICVASTFWIINGLMAAMYLDSGCTIGTVLAFLLQSVHLEPPSPSEHPFNRHVLLLQQRLTLVFERGRGRDFNFCGLWSLLGLGRGICQSCFRT